ncbi:Uncharacterised protein [Yersinia thracica]|uniref:Uncharacterized protein n=1 Tax=Yersinia thracica TaxID=2890319 RepID=A0A0T9NSY2_9GAMM|nr:Uncharacterised protein [Yersinia thracica]
MSPLLLKLNRFSFHKKKEPDPLSFGDEVTLKRFKECVSDSEYMQVFCFYS